MSLIQTENVVLLGDVGTIFRVTIVERVFNATKGCWEDVAVDVSTASTMEILFEKPSGKVAAKPAVFSSDGSDGKIEHVGGEDLVDEAGGPERPWKFAGYVELPGGKKHSSLAATFVVEAGVPRPALTLTPLPAMATLGVPAVTVSIA